MAENLPETAAPMVGERTVRRIVYLTPTFGILAAVAAAIAQRWDWAEGLLFGTALGWLNFRWLKRGLEAFTRAAASAAPQAKRSGSGATYLAAVFRYVLIGLAVYVIFTYLHVPLLSIASGLCALAVATIAASVWEIVQSVKMRS